MVKGQPLFILTAFVQLGSVAIRASAAANRGMPLAVASANVWGNARTERVEEQGRPEGCSSSDQVTRLWN